MKISKEHEYLLETVKIWFNHPEQVSHYSDELLLGPTTAEKYLLDLLDREGTVLDIGCGGGRISVYLANQGYHVTGLDVSRELLSVAREYSERNNQNIHFVQTEGTSLPFPDDEFDVLIAFKILCYIPTRELRSEAFKEYFRVLKPGGTCIITQHIVPEEYIEEAKDEYFQSHPAATFEIIEEGDNFPLGSGYVHWFTHSDLLSEVNSTDFVLDIFESDVNYGDTGHLRLIMLRKPQSAL
ncbi:class I SAM-dependent methyltransferase [Paenibacillus sp. KQZ6P-2]|uniref:Class I SAM-dependent methyltransferase n=1 Tax=Paenibacillus mangrovi TaxID=2931978 RepID=A0A9X1WK40_9BACL|nr:class I SAM-dependent methyltransferase [Paenibacillus mangrovi]MCJ8010797.1 class I SAM-dependent methyltransferase [Paenibacillus mangrovi]